MRYFDEACHSTGLFPTGGTFMNHRYQRLHILMFSYSTSISTSTSMYSPQFGQNQRKKTNSTHTSTHGENPVNPSIGKKSDSSNLNSLDFPSDDNSIHISPPINFYIILLCGTPPEPFPGIGSNKFIVLP